MMKMKFLFILSQIGRRKIIVRRIQRLTIKRNDNSCKDTQRQTNKERKECVKRR